MVESETIQQEVADLTAEQNAVPTDSGTSLPVYIYPNGNYTIANGETISDGHAYSLYTLLQITSQDIGFHWATEMLMLHILGYVSESKQESDFAEDLKSTILATFTHGDKLWAKMEPHLEEIREIAE